ncbi:MAG: SAM-dependent methyltransferase [Acidimicrobiales bacterium]
MTTDDAIVDHYERDDLVGSIEAALGELGRPIDDLTVDDLAPVDEFHVGGRPATASFMDRLELESPMRVLDVGCGLGGPARFAATTYGCAVTGIDLTASYIEAAGTLTGWVGLDDTVSFRKASTADLVDDGAGDGRSIEPFDAAYLMHVGMNVADKPALFADIARLLKPGGTLGIYDLLRFDDGELGYPMPWASSAATSFVETTVAYESGLAAAGFELVVAQERQDMATAFVATVGQAAASSSGPPSPVGLHLVMGSTIGAKVRNLTAALEAELLKPVELLARRAP